MNLLFAGLSCKWGDLWSLCVLHFFPSLNEATYPTLRATRKGVLREFFGRLSNIVELNVNSMHFDDGVDFRELLATTTLLLLCALSRSPCSLRKSGSARRLAMGLSQMDDLDIRLNMDVRHDRCNYCDRELLLGLQDARAFNATSDRLTLSNMPHLASLDFLKICPVPHLRFIDVSDRLRFDFRALACSIRHGQILRSLVVKIAHIDFDIGFLK
ncbi:hypothetical protein MTO96_027360 [Rhipicephalus appendiculatus]